MLLQKQIKFCGWVVRCKIVDSKKEANAFWAAPCFAESISPPAFRTEIKHIHIISVSNINIQYKDFCVLSRLLGTMYFQRYTAQNHLLLILYLINYSKLLWG